jgi:hypothetical protein
VDENLFKQRTKRLALRIIEIVESLPKNRTADVLGRQLLDLALRWVLTIEQRVVGRPPLM